MSIRLRVLSALFLGCVLMAPVFAQAAVSDSSTSQFEKTLVTLTNTDRLVSGDTSVTENSLLSLAAQKKADDMAMNGYFAHYSPTGISPWYWFTSVGYYYTHAGENLAINFDSPATVEAAWMASPTHRANIVKSIYTQTGIGIAHGMYQGKPATFIVQLFATPS